jgi:hypothetical protein
MAKVRAEDKLTGRVAGVEFVDGEGETDNPGSLAFFRRKPGFTVEPTKPARKRTAKKS